MQPQLKFGDWNHRLLAGEVKSFFSNKDHIQQLCSTPIRSDELNLAANTCLQIEHAAQGFHNYVRYISYWGTVAKVGNGTTDMKRRPPGFGLFNENITVSATWIDIQNTTELSIKNGRVVNQVSLAYPHAGVFQAAHDPRNNIIQPEELDGIGYYSLHASAPSPVINVMCANMNADELRPIVYDTWNSNVVNTSTWPTLMNNATTRNNTVVDDLFGWDKSDINHFPPVFARYPSSFNTIMNHTSLTWNRPEIYLLGQGGATDGPRAVDYRAEYLLCQIRVSRTPACSTRYNATGSGGTFEAICENSHDNLSYLSAHPNSTREQPVSSWMSVVSLQAWIWSLTERLTVHLVRATSGPTVFPLIRESRIPTPATLGC